MEWHGLIELGVVVMFLLGWGVLELYTRRLDKKREAEAKRDAERDQPPQP